MADLPFMKHPVMAPSFLLVVLSYSVNLPES